MRVHRVPDVAASEGRIQYDRLRDPMQRQVTRYPQAVFAHRLDARGFIGDLRELPGIQPLSARQCGYESRRWIVGGQGGRIDGDRDLVRRRFCGIELQLGIEGRETGCPMRETEV